MKGMIQIWDEESKFTPKAPFDVTVLGIKTGTLYSVVGKGLMDTGSKLVIQKKSSPKKKAAKK